MELSGDAALMLIAEMTRKAGQMRVTRKWVEVAVRASIMLEYEKTPPTSAGTDACVPRLREGYIENKHRGDINSLYIGAFYFDIMILARTSQGLPHIRRAVSNSDNGA